MHKLLYFLAWLYLLLAALLIYGLPYSSYEWMLDRIEAGTLNPYCSLPVDDNGGMLLVTLAVLVPVVLGAPAYALARKRWGALLFGALAVVGYAVLKWTLLNPLSGC